MKTHFDSFQVQTRGKGTYEITRQIATVVKASGIQTGLVTVFIRHTSASLVIYENADPSAREDLHTAFDDLIDEQDPKWVHTLEGCDDTSSHLRMALTRTSENIPVHLGEMTLGTWQGIFVFEHRSSPHQRTIDVIVMGTEPATSK